MNDTVLHTKLNLAHEVILDLHEELSVLRGELKLKTEELDKCKQDYSSLEKHRDQLRDVKWEGIAELEEKLEASLKKNVEYEKEIDECRCRRANI